MTGGIAAKAEWAEGLRERGLVAAVRLSRAFLVKIGDFGNPAIAADSLDFPLRKATREWLGKMPVQGAAAEAASEGPSGCPKAAALSERKRNHMMALPCRSFPYLVDSGRIRLASSFFV